MQPFTPGVASEPSSRVEIALSATDLLNKDLLSKSDPFVVTYLAIPGATTWREIHRTEVIRDSLNPVFAAKAEVTYKFEEQQKLRFEVYDQDSTSSSLSAHDFLGAAECSLGQLVSAGALELQLAGHHHSATGDGLRRGCLKLTVEEVQWCKKELELQFRGKNLDKKDWGFWCSSDPFFEIYRSTESGSFVLVHRSEVIKNTLKPVWQMFRIKLSKLCNADLDRNLKFLCWDWNRSGTHEVIGEFYTTARKLAEGGTGPTNEYQLINEDLRKKKKNYSHSGEISVVHSNLIDVPTFLDYIRGGTELQCTFAIDFTASNGNPREITSLHNVTSGMPNQYEQAIRAVGDIIRDYDTDKMFPVLGFGARLPPDGRISHEFFVNLDGSNPYCADIDGVLAAYKTCISRVQLYGPTNFAPVIHHVAQFARQYRDGSQYFILLIITDGAITDMPQTKEAIVEASSLPMSIIIVGVGNAEFDAMEELDGDTVRISARGRFAARDIVQFVPMREFSKSTRMFVPIPGLPPDSRRPEMVELARAVLAEIPDQFLGWMMANGIKPNPPKSTVVQVPVDPEIYDRSLNDVPGFADASAPPPY